MTRTPGSEAVAPGGGAARLLVHLDYVFHTVGDDVYTDRAFIVFVQALANHFERVTVAGRVAPAGPARYKLADGVGFVGLGFYEAVSRPLHVVRALAGSARRFWRALDDADVVWLLGPHPLSLGFSALAAIRRRRIVLGARQDLPRYVRFRHPGRRAFGVAADVMEALWQAMARIWPVIVVGPDLARRYRRSRRLLQATISLTRTADLVETKPESASSRDGELRILSVGRLDAEKNPLLLAEIGTLLEAQGRPWRMRVCGEGPLQEPLRRRVRELGLEHRFELAGYIPWDTGLRELYLDSDVLLHVSLTEGLPQVLFEAFAARLPVVATDVGGVRDAVDGAALLVPPRDAAAAAEAVLAVAGDGVLRNRLVEAGGRRAREHTLEAESARVARFIADSASPTGTEPGASAGDPSAPADPHSLAQGDGSAGDLT